MHLAEGQAVNPYLDDGDVQPERSNMEPATTHWLRVPPGCNTAREAVAWTFDTDEYQPQVQT